MKRTLICRLAGFVALVWLLIPISLSAQTVSPISGLGSIQVFDNTGNLATGACFYFFQAGTSTQQATYSDSTGNTVNTNPLCVSSGARATGVWLTTSAFYKIQACQFNDGPFCNAGDILWQQDNIPGGASSGGGSSCSAGCVGFFVSGTASPSTSGVLRMASGDTFGWRNAAGSSNLLFSKTSNDILQWNGSSVQFPVIASPASSCGNAGFTCLWSDNTANRWMMKNNGGSAVQVVASGNDINTSDSVVSVHFGATQVPFGSTSPSTLNQCLQWNGTNIIPATGAEPGVCGPAIAKLDLTNQSADVPATTILTPAADGLYRATAWLTLTTVAGTSSTLPPPVILFTDADSGQANIRTLGNTNSGNALGTNPEPAVGSASVGMFVYFKAKSGVPIQAQTTGYASNPAAAMKFAMHILVEGPF